MASCFYCGVSLRPKKDWHPIKGDVDWDSTRDHIYPKASIEAHTGPLPPNFERLNIVACCRKCNSYKGHLHPLDWLVIMPDSVNAHRLAERLVKMGEDMENVFASLRRRRR